MSTPVRPQFARLAVGARVFGLVVLSAPALWSRDDTGVLALVAIGTVWLASSMAEELRVNATVVSLVEAGAVGAIAALSIDASLAALGALALPPFTAALRRGPRGMLLALSAELIPLVVLSGLLHGGYEHRAGRRHVHLGGHGCRARPDRRVRAGLARRAPVTR